MVAALLSRSKRLECIESRPSANIVCMFAVSVPLSIMILIIGIFELQHSLGFTFARIHCEALHAHQPFFAHLVVSCELLIGCTKSLVVARD